MGRRSDCHGPLATNNDHIEGHQMTKRIGLNVQTLEAVALVLIAAGCSSSNPPSVTGTAGSTAGTTGSTAGTTGSTAGTTGSTAGTTGSTAGTSGGTAGTTGTGG